MPIEWIPLTHLAGRAPTAATAGLDRNSMWQGALQKPISKELQGSVFQE